MYRKIAVVIALVIAYGCSPKSETAEENQAEEEVIVDADEWPELDEFHMIMAESFHPYKDSMNIDPAKLNAAEMAQVAARWADASLPAKVNTDEVKSIIAALKLETEAFATLVSTGTAEEIGAALTHVHDTFHKVQERWYGGGEMHKEEEHSEEH